MGYRKVSFAPQAFYHVYNRGNSKQDIFLNDADFTRFQELLYLTNTARAVSVKDARRSGVYEQEQVDPLVSIGAYCILPNHFHILLTPRTDGGVTTFMKKLLTGYSMYFNKRYNRTGSLFEGRFKATYADDDVYLKYLFAYIHLNPLKLKYLDWRTRVGSNVHLLREAEEYAFSSFRDHLSEERNESMILSKGSFPEYFNDAAAWRKEMQEWITYTPE